MICLGTEILDQLVTGTIHNAKMVFNDRGAILFSVAQQHRDVKAEGISYEDNCAGNALAAIVRRDAIEVRFHGAFDDRAVARLVSKLIALPSFAHLASAEVTYQGRVIAK